MPAPKSSLRSSSASGSTRSSHVPTDSTSPASLSGSTPYCSSQSAESAVVSRSTSSSSVADGDDPGRAPIAQSPADAESRSASGRPAAAPNRAALPADDDGASAANPTSSPNPGA